MTPSRRLQQKQLAASVQALHPNANLMPCLISVVTGPDAEASNGRAHKHPSLVLDSKNVQVEMHDTSELLMIVL